MCGINFVDMAHTRQMAMLIPLVPLIIIVVSCLAEWAFLNQFQINHTLVMVKINQVLGLFWACHVRTCSRFQYERRNVARCYMRMRRENNKKIGIPTSLGTMNPLAPCRVTTKQTAAVRADTLTSGSEHKWLRERYCMTSLTKSVLWAIGAYHTSKGW